MLEAYPQCASLRQQRNITFNTDKDCAPVTVTDFTITYFFNSPQDPSLVEIQFEWNDPDNNIDRYGQGDASFSVDVSSTEFTATGTFTYPSNEDCVFEPVSSVIYNGALCETSEQEQVVTSWARDNDFGGAVEVNPGVYPVCYDNVIDEALFVDNSTFNCNINLEADNPNRLDRYTQFVYGTNHNSATSIRNLSLEEDDGTIVNLTDGAANLSSTSTRSGVTAVYFGPVVNIPFPADGPNMTSYPMSAPADVNNLVGNEFEITLYNWNICNPYNGDANNPNYDEAVTTTAYIRIVDPPTANFQTRLNDASGTIQSTFCLGSDIYFENLSSNAGSYEWEFYDDVIGNTLLSSSNGTNPTYSYSTTGDKLIRLLASNPSAEGECEEMYERIISISPTAIADFEFYNEAFDEKINAEFCVDSLDSVVVGFRDLTSNIESGTEWRWELYDVDGSLKESIPDGSNAFGDQVTDFTRTYNGVGIYLVKLIARNNLSHCVSEALGSVILYDKPAPNFEFTKVCEGEPTTFDNISDSVSNSYTQVNNDFVSLYEWDMNYNGDSFDVDLSFVNNDEFSYYLDGSELGSEPNVSVAGTYTVALRMTTEKGGCSSIIMKDIEVFPLPNAELSSSYVSPICPGDSIWFTNESFDSSLDYSLAITDSLTYYDTLTIDSAVVYSFANAYDTIRRFHVRMIAESGQGCLKYSPFIKIEVLPSFNSDFDELNYSIFRGNCSPWESTVIVDEVTQNLLPDVYTWTILADSVMLPAFPMTIDGGDPDLDYRFENNGNTNQLISIKLEVDKSDACIAPSQHDYMINPQPSGEFAVDQIDSCGFVTFYLEAFQKGLPGYNWNISPIPDQWLDEDDQQTLLYMREDPDGFDKTVRVRLVTENLAGCVSDTTTNELLVQKSKPEIEASFQVVQDTVVLPEGRVDFVNTSSVGLEYVWSFADGDSSFVYAPGAHNYTEAGIYRVSLAVSNGFCESVVQRNVVVLPANPIIDFVADTTSGCRPFTVSFENNSAFAIPESYYWEFGDGNSSVAEHPVHTYGNAGIYTVRLYGENAVGAGADLVREDYITVFAQPVADFSLRPGTVYIPDQKVYFRNSSENADTYHWEFGDGVTSEAYNPVHQYTTLGTYDVTLVASNDNGCADTLTLFSAVDAIEGGRQNTPNAFSPGGSGVGESETINDVFIPRVEGVTKFRMLIYNRWGQQLFESHDKTRGWDGYYKGTLQPADVYVYRLELTYSDGREQVKVGDITLVR